MAKQAVKTDLTRADMEKIINGGGSVYHNGEIITKLSDLPNEEDLAGTPEQKEDALAKLRAEQSALNDRIAALEGGQPKSEAGDGLQTGEPGTGQGEGSKTGEGSKEDAGKSRVKR